jgi:hypothetical protein
MFVLAVRLLLSRVGGFKIALLFGLMHLAGIADRRGDRRLARVLSRWVTLEHNRSTIARILDTRFQFAITEGGGCAIDIDTEEEYDAMQARYEEWMASQRERVVALYGERPEALPAPQAQPRRETMGESR